MKQEKNIKMYNILLPIWLLIFLPTWLWLILIPANYLIDRIVLRWSLGEMPDKGLFCRKHTWKICLAGFLSDFAGVLLMLGVILLGVIVPEKSQAYAFIDKLIAGICSDPFDSIQAFILVVIAIALAGWLIYLIDGKILKKAGLDETQAKKSALRLAVITAPYTFLIPSGLIYNNLITGF